MQTNFEKSTTVNTKKKKLKKEQMSRSAEEKTVVAYAAHVEGRFGRSTRAAILRPKSHTFFFVVQ
jgi:hypothetical protein